MIDKYTNLQSVKLEKLVHGGQCLGYIDSKPVFVWGGLPGESVEVRITKKRSKYLEGVVNKVNKTSTDRIEPREPLSYLSTSPWQIMTFDAESKAKQEILFESFQREGLKDIEWKNFASAEDQYGYRNKMEMGFWGDDEGLHLAHYVRGSHGKQKVQGSALAMDCINKAAVAVRGELSRMDVWAGNLKTILLRANQQKEVVGALFVKKELDFKDFHLPKELKGIKIYYSDPKSPASLLTRLIYSLGDIKLEDSVMGKNITYDVLSFFQVNLKMFEMALSDIKDYVDSGSLDMYAGVGTIGAVVDSDTLVEIDENSHKFIQLNSPDAEAVLASSEKAVDYIAKDKTLILDPPRAGLHKDVIDSIMLAKPPRIIYLSCNPATQARDLSRLTEFYKIIFARGYNFFTRTPHIESLVILDKR